MTNVLERKEIKHRSMSVSRRLMKLVEEWNSMEGKSIDKQKMISIAVKISKILTKNPHLTSELKKLDIKNYSV